MRLTKIAFGRGELSLVAVGMVATMILPVCAFADAPDYSTYVQLTASDTVDDKAATTSWQNALHWSDNAAPSSDKNYYVPAGRILVHTHATDNATKNTWNGGQLAVAGKFHVFVSIGNQNGCLVPDLVLLPGSEVRADCYAPFYTYNSTTSQVTVAGTMENPAVLSQHYYNSDKERSHAIYANFVGTSSSVLVYTRPAVNWRGRSLGDSLNFYLNLHDFPFKDYGGTLILRGSNSYVKLAEARTFNWPNTALRIEDGAVLMPYYGGTFNDDTKNMYLRSLAFEEGLLKFNRNSSPNVLFPVINVTEGLSFGEGAVIVVPSAVGSYIPYRTPEGSPNGGKMFHLANLSGTAAANLPDLSNVKLCYDPNTIDVIGGVGLQFYDGENGSKDLYIAAPDVVAMTNANIETTSGSKIQYSAFQSGHAGDWTNLETPPSDSTLHYWAKQRLCFFQNTELPNATLTIDANSSWKAGSRLTFKEFNLLTGRSFGMWSSNSQRTLTADRVSIVKRVAAAENAIIYVFASLTLTINADLCGNGDLLLRNNGVQAGTVALSHVNTNYHGRLTLQCVSGSPKYMFTAVLNDARNFGGAYTMNTNTYDAITFNNFPNISVTNDATFVEPTRNMLITGGAQFTVDTGKTLTLANQVTYAGELVKAGAGTLELAGTTRFIDGAAATAPVATTNMLTVSDGALKVSAKDAAKGLAVSFAEGTKLIIPADSEYGYCNTLWDAPLTIDTTSGKLPVEVEMTGNEGTGDITVPICTFNATAAAEIPETAFTVLRASNNFRQKGSVMKRTNGDGSVTYLATLGLVGTQLLIR